MSVGKRIVNYISSFRLDDRSIAVFRILLGISVLYNIALLKLPYVVEFWGLHTVIPIDILKNMNGPRSISIFDYIRNDTFAYIYCVIAIISACLFTLGYKSKYNSILLFFMYWNFMQASANWCGGYDLINYNLLLWSIFLPLDNHFSIKPPKIKPSVSLAASIVLTCQICWIYFATGMAKYGTAWTEGYAVKIMASDKWVTYKTAAFFANNIWVYKPLTYLTLFFELTLPIFILFPLRKTPILRYIAILFLIGFHVSIFSIYDVANFSIAGLSIAAVLLPEAFWQKWKVMPSKTSENAPATSAIMRNLRYAKYAFFLLAFYVINLNNIKFLALYSPLSKTNVGKQIYQYAPHISIYSPFRISFFFQYWKMFAPEPIRDIGWLSIEHKKKDGQLYDLFSDKKIDPKHPVINYKPRGYEFQLLIYTRAMRFKNKLFTRVFLKYWFLHQLKIRNIPEANYKDYYLAEYRFYYPPQQEDISNIKVEKNLYDIQYIRTFADQ